jgi:hypothetical protein
MPEIPRLMIKFSDIFQMIESDGKITFVKLLVEEDGSIKVDRVERAQEETQSFPTQEDIRAISEESPTELISPPIVGIPSLSTE